MYHSKQMTHPVSIEALHGKSILIYIISDVLAARPVEVVVFHFTRIGYWFTHLVFYPDLSIAV